MGKKILIVDDSSTTRSMIKRIVRMTGLPVDEIHEAADGCQALAFLAAAQVDLVLADLNMPNMDGAEMVRHMRASAALHDVPVVIISAQPDPMRVVQLKSDGVVGYLNKPFTPENMRDLIGPILKQTAGVNDAHH